MKDMAEVKLACPVCGHDMVFRIPASDVRFRVTNADRIRSMSDEELANWITDIDPDNPCPPDNFCSCEKSNCMAGWLKWLKSEAKDVC